MKIVVTESKMKSFIKDKFGLDFSGDIKEITNPYGVLNDFDSCFSYVYLNRKLNNNGPAYLIKIDDNFKIIYQKDLNLDRDWIIDNDCRTYDESDLMDILGISALGLTMDDLIELYL